MQPMKLTPIFKNYLWGGTRLAEEYHKNTTLRPLAESWEVSTHPDGASVIENGVFAGLTLAQVLEVHPEYIGGEATEFPVLIKLIDAKDPLSLQVHPSDDDAIPTEGERGKNEMWYVMDAEPGAQLIVGLNEEVSPDEIRTRIENNTILDIANSVPVTAGDCFAIPAGMLHAIGGGTLIAEVQQNSNITYRVYDYDRRDEHGHARELHVEKAISVIDSSLKTSNLRNIPSYSVPGCTITPLLDWEYFFCEKVVARTVSQHYASKETFHALLVVEGTITHRSTNNVFHLEAGSSLFVPAGFGEYKLEGPGTVLIIKRFREPFLLDESLGKPKSESPHE